MRIQIPAWKPRFLRYSSVEDVHPLPPHALAPALPRTALRLALRQAQDFQHFRNPFDRLRTWQLFWQPVYGTPSCGKEDGMNRTDLADSAKILRLALGLAH